jgi:hypothetical protein
VAAGGGRRGQGIRLLAGYLFARRPVAPSNTVVVCVLVLLLVALWLVVRRR